MFKIGQKVVCINASNFPFYKVGDIYIVQDILFCQKCGRQCINVGRPSTGGTHCSYCMIMIASSGHYPSSELFAPLEEKSETMFDDLISKIFNPEVNSVKINITYPDGETTKS